MKRVLITGENSYIGTSLENWLMKEPDDYLVDSISVKDSSWKDKNFNQYDVVFHVAGIAHIKESKENNELYYKVNRDLAYKVAKKAKSDGVKQFIFLSSMSVYGLDNGVINKDTPLRPTSAYGKSKIEAEDLIITLESSSFIVAILRPPMVYGKGCKGNYPKLASLSLKTPIFPDVNNKRSMIYIDNLSDIIKQIIASASHGLYLPQNKYYVNTSEMVKLIAEVHEKKLFIPKQFSFLINKLNIGIINKVFGDLVYDMEIANKIDTVSFKESIKLTENIKEV
ncbi:NAD-dependent epimerase/dehydratase family protein [Carnobacterium sp. TMP28]|uniref:NAD-dependent epimerase/dehydratase family protein n=1 Tax=Carnobacterium sp. TMP28 TaxID=3397060 RepID=UPI0039DF9384